MGTLDADLPCMSGALPPPLFFLFCHFSFLVNPTLLPQLNTDVPRPSDAVIPGALGCGEHGGIASFLVCEIMCTKGISLSECVN